MEAGKTFVSARLMKTMCGNVCCEEKEQIFPSSRVGLKDVNRIVVYQ